MAAPYKTLGPIGAHRAMSYEPPIDPPDCDDDASGLDYLSIHAQTKQIEALIDDARYRLATDDAESFRDLLGLALMRMHELCIEAGVDDPDYGWTKPAHPQAEQLAQAAQKAEARRFAEQPVAITGFAELQP